MSIPCWITNRDAMFVKTCAESLANMRGVGRITILDCDSTYPELLEWYDSQSEFRVLRLKNLHNHAAWRCGEDLAGDSPFYLTTDGDLDFTECERDLLEICQQAMTTYPELIKVGPSLKIDDLPDTQLNKAVRAHESRFWQKEWSPLWYEGLIDTTAALYRKGTGWRGYGPALRAKPPYEVRHLPWYLTEPDPSFQHYVSRMKEEGLSWSPRFKLHCRPTSEPPNADRADIPAGSD